MVLIMMLQAKNEKGVRLVALSPIYVLQLSYACVCIRRLYVGCKPVSKQEYVGLCLQVCTYFSARIYMYIKHLKDLP